MAFEMEGFQEYTLTEQENKSKCNKTKCVQTVVESLPERQRRERVNGDLLDKLTPSVNGHNIFLAQMKDECIAFRVLKSKFLVRPQFLFKSGSWFLLFIRHQGSNAEGRQIYGQRRICFLDMNVNGGFFTFDPGKRKDSAYKQQHSTELLLLILFILRAQS